MKNTLSISVLNAPGNLSRIAGLFARRGFSIESIAMGPTENPRIGRMTIVVNVDKHPMDQVAKQLHKLINVVKLIHLEPQNSVERELMLIKVAATPEKRSEIVENIKIFRGKIVDLQPASIIAEVTGTTEKLQAIEELLSPYGIMEIVRTGKVALARR